MKFRLATSYLLLTCILLLTFQEAVSAHSPASSTVAAESKIIKNLSPLSSNAFYPLPLTTIKPCGWLRRQLEIQARGLSGHLDEFWPDLSTNSGWLGGTGESWERGPYYTDGLVPLAYLLNDPKLIAKANKWVNWTLTHQRPDGAIGPEKLTDWWPNMVMLKALTQYQEATGDPRVIPLMQRYFKYQAQHMAERPLHEWAKFRWGEEVLSVLWLYNRTGDKQLLDLARALHAQGHDWKSQFAHFAYPLKTSKEMLGLKPDMSNVTEASLSAHGVNNGMALKYLPVWSLVTNDALDRNAIYRQLKVLDQYHLLPNGMHSGDEHYAGKDPSQGVETCTVVEAMFSFENLIAILGDPAFGDRLERIAYNALPGAFTDDMWAHQYDQQPNQVLSNVYPRDWTTNGPESNVFGLEPNFACCLVNMHQGWPKLAANLWMATANNGLATIAYAPNEVQTIVRNKVPVRIVEETEYPFREKINFTIDVASAVQFPLQLRIPAWAQNAAVTVNGKTLTGIRAGTFHKIDRIWKKGDRVELLLPMRVRTSHWYQNSIALERGPLVYALKIGEDWKQIKQDMYRPAASPAMDWEVRPTTAWNYGLDFDAANPEEFVQVIEKPIGDAPFTRSGAPIELRVKGRRLPQWTLVKGSAGPLPTSPVASREPIETLTLIPYGAAKLRITAFPQIAGK